MPSALARPPRCQPQRCVLSTAKPVCLWPQAPLIRSTRPARRTSARARLGRPASSPLNCSSPLPCTDCPLLHSKHSKQSCLQRQACSTLSALQTNDPPSLCSTDARLFRPLTWPLPCLSGSPVPRSRLCPTRATPPPPPRPHCTPVIRLAAVCPLLATTVHFSRLFASLCSVPSGFAWWAHARSCTASSCLPNASSLARSSFAQSFTNPPLQAPPIHMSLTPVPLPHGASGLERWLWGPCPLECAPRPSIAFDLPDLPL